MMEKLTIVNGMVMYNLIKDGKLNIAGEVAPFNDAMCQGYATENIFSADFIMERATAMHVMPEEYEEIVVNYLRPMFDGEYDMLHLYFDRDMFCIINLITVLAYLERNDYAGEIQLHLMDYRYNVTKTIVVKSSGFFQLYKNIIVERHVQLPQGLPEEIHKGLALYILYAAKKSIVHRMIAANPYLSREKLLRQIAKRTPQYGLGDRQILEEIDSLRGVY